MTFLAIRPAKRQDVDALAELCVEHAEFERGRTSGTELAARLTEALFGETPLAGAWVAVRVADGQVVGFASASAVFSTWQGKEFLHLDCLYLVESARGYGGGYLLLAAVREHAVQRKISWLEWQTPAANTAAIRFYERVGAAALAKQRFSLSSAP